MICANMGVRSHRGTAATLQALRPFCMWGSMEVPVAAFFEGCVHCIDGKAGTLKLRPLGEVVHGTEVGEVIYFDLLHIEMGDRWGITALSMMAASTPSSW